MSVKVYVIEDGLAMSYMTDINSFKQFLSTDKILNLKEPMSFETEADAEAFCACLNQDESFENEPYKWPLRSYHQNELPFIKANDYYR